MIRISHTCTLSFLYNGAQYLPSIFSTLIISPSDLQNIVTIAADPNPLVAGTSHSLTCQVHSDLPPTLSWLDSQGQEITSTTGEVFIGQPTRFGLNSTLTLTFDTLKTSHGSRYSCKSVIGMPFSQETAERDVIVQSKSLIPTLFG